MNVRAWILVPSKLHLSSPALYIGTPDSNDIEYGVEDRRGFGRCDDRWSEWVVRDGVKERVECDDSERDVCELFFGRIRWRIVERWRECDLGARGLSELLESDGGRWHIQ